MHCRLLSSPTNSSIYSFIWLKDFGNCPSENLQGANLHMITKLVRTIFCPC